MYSLLIAAFCIEPSKYTLKQLSILHDLACIFAYTVSLKPLLLHGNICTQFSLVF